jgi:hypothetical protein
MGGQLRTSILFTMVWNRSRDLELDGLGPFIGSKQTSDFADVGAEGGGYNGEEKESEESQEVEVNSRI